MSTKKAKDQTTAPAPTDNHALTLGECLLALSAEARLRGQELMVKAASFSYAGFVTSVVEDKAILIEGAKFIFDTGEFTKPWADASAVPSGKWYVMIDAIESFGIMR